MSSQHPLIPPLQLKGAGSDATSSKAGGGQRLRLQVPAAAAAAPATETSGSHLMVSKGPAKTTRSNSNQIVADVAKLGALVPIDGSGATKKIASTARSGPMTAADMTLHSKASGGVLPDIGAALVPRPPHTVTKDHFDNTLTSTCSVDTLQGRIRALENAVQRTPRLDPIAAWPTKPGASLAAASNRGFASGARPPLAVEIEGFIRKELTELTFAVRNPTPLQMLPIFREAFACLINHFTEYRDVFLVIKREYDAVIDDLGRSQQQLTKLQTEMRSLKEFYTMQLQEEREKLGTTISDLQAQLAASLKANHNQRNTQTKLEKEIVNLKEQVAERDTDIDDAQDRIRLLTSTTRELGAKNSTLLVKLGKAQTHNEHLLAMIQTLQEKLKSVFESGPATLTIDTSSKNTSSPTAGSSGASASPPNAGLSRADLLAATGQVRKDLKRTIREMVLTSQSERSGSISSVSGANLFGTSDASAAAASGGAGNASSPYAMADEEDLREAVFELEAKIKKLQRTNFDLKSQVNNLMQRIDKMQRSREDETLTPRPNWIHASQQLPDFHLNHLQTSEEILEDLVIFVKEKLRDEIRANERAAYSKAVRAWMDEEDMCDADLAGKVKYFIGKGTGPHVPRCLRWNGRVRNKRMKKGDVETLLGKFWSERRQMHKADSVVNVVPVQQYLFDWLQRQTGSENKAIELAYNIFHICETYQSDPDCSMFLKIFRGEISEASIFDQLETVNRLREVVERHDKSKKGAVSRVTMQRIMNAYFKAKSTEDMLRLRFALVISCKGSAMVDYNALFSEDEDGNQSRFVELVRRQHTQEISSFVVEVEEALRAVISAEAGTIMMNSARNAIKQLDPKIPDERITEILAYACGMTPLEYAAAGEYHSAAAEPFLARIRCGLLLKRHSAKPENEDDGDEAEDGGEGSRDGASRVFDDGFFSEEELKQMAHLLADDDDGVAAGEEPLDLDSVAADTKRQSVASNAANLIALPHSPGNSRGSMARVNASPRSSSLNPTADSASDGAAAKRAASVVSINPRFLAQATTTKEEREREARERRATAIEREIGEALQQQERDRQAELERRRGALDTFALFAAHPSAAGAVNMQALVQMRREVELEASRLEESQRRRVADEAAGVDESLAGDASSGGAGEDIQVGPQPMTEKEIAVVM